MASFVFLPSVNAPPVVCWVFCRSVEVCSRQVCGGDSFFCDSRHSTPKVAVFSQRSAADTNLLRRRTPVAPVALWFAQASHGGGSAGRRREGGSAASALHSRHSRQRDLVFNGDGSSVSGVLRRRRCSVTGHAGVVAVLVLCSGATMEVRRSRGGLLQVLRETVNGGLRFRWLLALTSWSRR